MGSPSRDPRIKLPERWPGLRTTPTLRSGRRQGSTACSVRSSFWLPNRDLDPRPDGNPRFLQVPAPTPPTQQQNVNLSPFFFTERQFGHFVSPSERKTTA